jgi:hypothetical protein
LDKRIVHKYTEPDRPGRAGAPGPREAT